MKKINGVGLTKDGIDLYSKDDFLGMQTAGKLAAQILDEIGEFVYPGQSTAEIDRITEFLSSQHISKPTLEQKLALLEQTYALREKDEFFKNKLLRILARWQQSLGNLDKANNYRARAFQEIQHALNGDLDGYKRLEYLYLATNYSKQFAEQNKNVGYLDDLETALKSVTDPELKGYAGYLSELIKDSVYINEGGKLDPDFAKQ